MTKEELIGYILANIKDTLEKEMPDEFFTEAHGLDYAINLINNKLVHIREAMFEAYLIRRKQDG